MYYINAISSISHQPTFNNEGFCHDIKALENDTEIIKPIYKEYINTKVLRRMGNLIRMSVACSTVCLSKIDAEVEGIIVGTGLGCLTDTAKFLNNFVQLEGLIPPTSFIQSTHNTIAGQISLNFKNNGYNTTYTQNTLSFELALEDAMLCLDEGMQNVLLGAADEFIPFLSEVKDALSFSGLNLTSGVTFLVLSRQKNDQTIAKIRGSQMIFNKTDSLQHRDQFLDKNNLSIKDIDIVNYSTSFLENEGENDNNENRCDITKLSGLYPTNSAFGLHLGVDQIQAKKAQKVLIFNNLNQSKLGLTLIESI